MKTTINKADPLISGIQKSLCNDGLRVKAISRLIENFVEHDGGINCYPSENATKCHDLAYFIALKSSPYAKGKGHLSFRKAMEKLLQHMQGTCSETTGHIIFITAHWDCVAYLEWKDVLSEMDNKIIIEFYLLSGNSSSIIYV